MSSTWSGRGWLAWRNWAGRLPPGEAGRSTGSGWSGCEANERITDEPFAAYSFVRHSSKWLGEYNALLFDAQRSVLHAVWAQPVNEGGVPRSRIFHATAALP